MKRTMIATGLVIAGCHDEHWPPRATEPELSIQVLAAAPGWSSDEVERLITIPLEVGLTRAPAVVGVHSTTEPGQARVVVDFARDDVLAARQEVIHRLQLAQLPPGIQPVLGRTSKDRIALRFLVRGPAMVARTVADWRLHAALETIVGVLDVDERGGDVEQVHVTLDPYRLAGFGMTAEEIRAAIASAVTKVGGSRLTMGDQAYQVRGIGQLESLAAIDDVVVKETGGVRVRVRDVATVARGSAPRDCDVTDERGQDVVEGIVWARADADVDTVRTLAETKLAQMAKTVPPGIAIESIAVGRETLVNLPVGTHGAAVVKGRGIVVESCLTLPSERSVPGDVVVMAKEVGEVPLAGIPGARVVPSGPATWIRISGDDVKQLVRLSGEVAAVAEKLGVAVTARVGTEEVQHITIAPDRARTARYGVTANELEEVTRLALGGVQIAQRFADARTVDIVMRLGSAATDVDAIRAIAIAMPDGTRVPLGELASVRSAASPRALVREDGARTVAMRVHVDDGDGRAELRRALDRIALPAGYRLVASSGSSTELP